MKILGIVAEYNPFHFGHLYHLEVSRAQSMADGVIAVMSGNFVQRGECALFDKFSRAAMALKAGVDLVVELPFLYASSSAEYFAAGAIDLLLDTRIVTSISFGTESSEVSTLKKVADILVEKRAALDHLFRIYSKEGFSYPIAQQKALSHFTTEVIRNPNDLLALQYVKRLRERNTSLELIRIPRSGQSHHQSAGYIRRAAKTGEWKHLLPDFCLPYVEGKTALFPDDFFEEILFAILTSRDLKKVNGMEEGLENLLKENAKTARNFEELLEMTKSKRYTRTRLSRLLFHQLFHVYKSDVESLLGTNYIRPLAFNETGQEMLRHMKDRSPLPIISNIPRFRGTKKEESLFSWDLLTSRLYYRKAQLPADTDFSPPLLL